MANFFEEFMAKLDPQEDRVNGADIILAEKHLPEDVTQPIPMCMFAPKEVPVDPANADMGITVQHFPRMDVVAVLAWVIAKRHDPDISIEQVSQGINNDNLRDIIDDIWFFWLGTKFYTEEVEDGDLNPPDPENQV